VLTADEALVDPDLARVLLDLYGSAIRSLTRDPHQRLSGSCFVDHDGVPLDSLSFAPADVPAITAPVSLLTTLDQTVEASPRAVAVRDERGTWTFAELRAAVLQVRALIGGSGKRVAIHLPRDRGLVAAVLGVLASGGVVVPLDPVEPEGRALHILTSAGVDLLLTDASGPHLTGVARLHLPEYLGVGGDDDVRLGHEFPARAAAVVLHTSGTTGLPRGVVLEHGSLETLLGAHQRTRMAGPARRVALSASIAFDAAWDQLLWLIAGHQLVVVPEEVRRDTIQLLQFVREHGIDVLDVPQSQISLLLELGALDSGPFPTTLVMGGEAVSPRLWSVLAARDDINSWNFYGPTECTIDALTSPVRASASPVVGRPVDGARVYVLDPGGRSAPPGVAGELHLAGPLLARGYLNDPGATASAFVPDPYSPVPGARMYRTGDVGRFRQDGSVELLGRLDEQRKIRGHRVEPAEVTATLLSLASVSDAATAYVSDSTGELQLCAYVVTDEPADRVRQLLLSLLPNYLVPSRISVVESIPRSITGKVNHKALETAPAVADASYEPPRPGVETVVASAMSEVLGVPTVGRDDDFFSLGGHSLRAARVVARVRVRFGVALSVRSLLDNPSVRTFSLAVAAAPVSSYAGPIPVLPAGSPTPASAAQARMWFLHQLDPSSSAYNMGEAFGFGQRLDLLALHGAVEQLTRRQAVLRTRFEVVESDLRQVVDDHWSGTVAEHVVDGSEDDVREKVEQLLAAPYDLDAGPVFRVDVVHASSQDVLVVCVHHVACDGVSIDVLFRELSTAYDARLAGVGDVLPPLPVQYTDVAAWQRRRTEAGDLDASVAFWQEHLRGAPTVVQWPGRRSERREEVASRSVEFEIDNATTERLRRLAAAEGVTLFTIVFTAFAQSMTRFTGSRDFVLGLPDAGRGHAVLEDLVGFFVNLLAVRVRTAFETAAGQPEPAFADLLVQARRLLADAFEHADAPFEQVVGAVSPERVPGVNPLVQVSVQVFEEQVDASFELGGQRARNVRADLRGNRLDLTLDVYLRGAGLCGWIYHAPSVVDVDGAKQLIQLFLVALSDAVARDVQVDPVGQEESNSMGQEWQRVEVGEHAVDLRVSNGQDGSETRRLFPSLGEYPVYDDFLYYVMLQDEPRNVLFESAITSLVQGRVVLELGTGPDLLWSGLAARSGARRVMAVEEIPASAQAALAKAATLPGVPVEVFEGSANDVSLPERAEVLIVELVGAIGGAEGIADVVSDAWRRHLEPGARVVPRRVATQVSALGARALLDGPPALHRNIAPYAADVWRSVDSVFDLRMCMTGMTPADLLASSELLEDLHLEANEQQHADVLSLRVTQAGEVDSLVLWLQLDCGAGEILDALQVTTNWMPTLVPFDIEEPVPVQPGDRLEVRVVRRLADDVHPEWMFEGEVHRQGEEPVAFRSDSAYASGPLRQTWLHRALLRHPVRATEES
jgi:amino acid adenylation domain-containing protein